MAKRWPVVVGGVLVAAVAALGAAGVVAAVVFDPNSQRDRITQAVRRATGRELVLAGPLRVGWGLQPVLDAEDVSFANAPGGSRPHMAEVGRVEARVKLLPLLSGVLDVASVTLVRPDILLETDGTGRGNWMFDRPAVPPGPPATSSPGPRLRTRLDSLRVESGRVTWRNGATGQTLVAEVPSATLDLADGPARVVAAAQVAGTAVKLDGTLGTWAQMTAPAPAPWPMRLAASVGDATIAFDGQAEAAGGVSGRVEATVPDLQRFGGVLGRPGWPALRAVHLAGTMLPSSRVPQDVSVQVGASDLGGVLPGATLGRLTLNWPAGQAARLEAEGGVYGGPWHVSAGAVPAGQGVALRGLTLQSPFGDLAGDLALQPGARPAVRGTLVSTRVDVDAIRGALRTAAPRPMPVPVPVPASPAPAAAPAPPVPGPVIPDAPLPWPALRRADADLQLTAATVRWGGVDYRSATGHLVLLDGVARLDPASAVTPAGRVDLSASADARAAAPPVALVVRSAGLSLDALLRAAGLPGGSDGSAEVDLVLQAAGASPRALAGSLGGHLGVAVVDGEVANAALAVAFGDLVKQAGVGLDPGGRSHVRCLAVRADADAGVVTLAAAKLDTARLQLEASGTVNLRDETVALHLHPLLRLGGAGVSAPVRVDGGFRHPVVALDGTGGRTGVVLGGLAGPSDTCSTELAAARDGHAGRLPAALAADAKLPKPADLLRSLLR